jgi:hypothetical protein
MDEAQLLVAKWGWKLYIKPVFSYTHPFLNESRKSEWFSPIYSRLDDY